MICASSAGVHAVLAHRRSSRRRYRSAWALRSLLSHSQPLRPGSTGGRRANRPCTRLRSLLGALLIAYVATRITAVPLLGDHREPIDAIGIATKLIEAVGLVLAIKPLNGPVASRKLEIANEKGALS
jgi:hypothetical protein